MRRLRAAGLVLAGASLLSSCAATSARIPTLAERTAEQLRQRGVDPTAAAIPFAITPEMHTWLFARVGRGGGAQERLSSLLRSLLGKDGVRLVYESGYTGTAEEVFRSGRANCLSFAHLFVGMARELGMPVYFLRVQQVTSFAKEGDLIVASGHITAGYGPPNDRRVLEFTEQPLGPYHGLEEISDLTAVALFHSNRGAELLRQGELSEARRWLELAARIDPDLPDAWVNLGVVRRRLRDLAGAEAAYRRALEADPTTFAAYQNLASLLQFLGRTREVQELLELLDRNRNRSRNPFSYLALGDLSLREGRLDEAERFYRRALRLDSSQAETQAALGELALARGREREARQHLRKAVRLDAGHPRVVRLAQRLSAKLPPATARP
ncbi:MAG: tetratricopeptide repeat protein [Acidobacteria bacterium]|jgi:tetratricopeptide (TPR) repeat protein|nr:tetratricopeptide repeat protein [Acidobacteriota bacterium]